MAEIFDMPIYHEAENPHIAKASSLSRVQENFEDVLRRPIVDIFTDKMLINILRGI